MRLNNLSPWAHNMLLFNEIFIKFLRRSGKEMECIFAYSHIDLFVPDMNGNDLVIV